MIIFRTEVETSTLLTTTQEINPNYIGIFHIESGIITFTPEGMFLKILEEEEAKPLYAGIVTHLNDNICIPGFTYPLRPRNQIKIFATKHPIGTLSESLERTITICERNES